MTPRETCSVCTGEYGHGDVECDEEAWPCPTLRALASVYAEHPVYRQEWRA
jgi:hypothetical protein